MLADASNLQGRPGEAGVVLVQPLLDHNGNGRGGEAEDETREPDNIKCDLPLFWWRG